MLFIHEVGITTWNDCGMCITLTRGRRREKETFLLNQVIFFLTTSTFTNKRNFDKICLSQSKGSELHLPELETQMVSFAILLSIILSQLTHPLISRSTDRGLKASTALLKEFLCIQCSWAFQSSFVYRSLNFQNTISQMAVGCRADRL